MKLINNNNKYYIGEHFKDFFRKYNRVIKRLKGYLKLTQLIKKLNLRTMFTDFHSQS